jgi:hypothetical protein
MNESQWPTGGFAKGLCACVSQVLVQVTDQERQATTPVFLWSWEGRRQSLAIRMQWPGLVWWMGIVEYVLSPAQSVCDSLGGGADADMLLGAGGTGF